MVVRKDTPWMFPIRMSDGIYTDKCQFGVKVDTKVEPVNSICPVCGQVNCPCDCSEDSDTAGVGSPTCCSCHWNVGVLDGCVVCAHPISLVE